MSNVCFYSQCISLFRHLGVVLLRGINTPKNNKKSAEICGKFVARATGLEPVTYGLTVIALAACDKPTSTAELTCNFDKYWQNGNSIYLQNSYGDFNLHDTAVDVKVVTYDNYAKVTADNITTIFEKVAESRYKGEFGRIGIEYKGNFPGSSRTAILSLYADITDKKILQYDVVFIGQKEMHDGKEFSVGHSCYPTKENFKGETWSAAVPFYHHYKMPNKIEQCIQNIVQNVYCENEKCTQLYIYNEKNGRRITLSQEQALSISKNWDYSNMKLYQNDGKLESHEKDACNVSEKLNKFMKDNNMGANDFIVIQRSMQNCGEDCGKVIANGEMGDFLIQLPETEELRKIANKQKTAKFLSTKNPNQYAKAGYCLVNIIPYNTMEKMNMPDNTCNYRIYCGAPEFMDYDEFYAVEACN